MLVFGMENRKRLSISAIQTIEQSMLFGDELLTVCRLEHEYGELDSVSFSLVRAVDRYTRPVVAALALTMLRFSDLSFEVICAFLEANKCYVRQKKTSILYRVKPLAPASFSYSCSIVVPTVPFHASYSCVREALLRAISRDLSQLLAGNNSACHIFRHLRASYLSAIGYSASDISAYLGHSSDGTCRNYVHDNIIDVYFRN